MSHRKHNLKKMAATKGRFLPAMFDMSVEFNAHSEDINAPLKHLTRAQRNLEMGSGFNLVTGKRDFSFRGTEKQIKAIMSRLCDGPFKVSKFSVYPNTSLILDNA